jgi:hypothetical protein
MLVKKAATNEELTVDCYRIPKSLLSNELRRRKHQEMAKQMVTNHQRKYDERIFPEHKIKD